MRTKITALICALTMMLSVLPTMVSAKFEAEAQLQDSLAQLGILSWTPMSKVSKGAFVYSLAGFLYDDVKKLATAEEAARSIGLIKDNEVFDQDARITTEEALKYAVITLGMKLDTDESEYTAIASQTGIAKGISLTNKYLENSDGLKILNNLLDAQPINGYISSTGEIVYRTDSEQTLLSKNRNIYELKGIVTANSRTSIYSTDKTQDGIIKIDGYEYIYNGKEDLLGNSVLAYVRKERNEDPEILYIGATARNEYLTLDTDDVLDVEANFSKIKYEDGERQKYAKLSTSPKVIYNGIFYGSYAREDFMGDNGNLNLIDNDSDGLYDVIFITSYETVVASSIDYAKMEFVNKYTYSGAMTSFKIQDEDEYVFYKNNEEIDINEIKVGDILSVAISKNASQKCVTVYVSDRKVEGVVNGKNDVEKEFNIDGKVYGVSEAFLNYISMESKPVSVGNVYTFSVDHFGNLAYFEKLAEDGYVLGLRVRELDDSYVLVYMDMRGDWHNGVLAEKVTLNETVRDTNAAIYTMLKTMEPQIMIISANSKGEIKTIETAINSGVYNPDRLTKSEATRIYRSQSLSFDHSVHLEDTAKLVVFPTNVSYNKADYYVKDASGYFSSDGSYAVTIYDVDEFNFTPLVSIKGTGSKLSRSLFVVTKVTKECDSDGDIRAVVYGNIGNFRDFVFSSKGESFVDASGNVLNIKAGDIINVSVDRKGYIDEASIVYSLNQDFVHQGTIAHNSNSVLSGTIEAIDSEKLRMRVRAGGMEYVALSTTLPVQVYNKGEKTCELKTVSELRQGSKVVMQFNWGAPVACVVVEE